MAGNPYDQTLEDVSGAPARNPYDQTLEQQDEDQQQQLRAHVAAASTTSPDAAADTLKISQSTGLPADIVARNLDDMRKRASIAQTPFADIVKTSPYLTDWLKQPQHAAVARDDMEPLGALEWITQAPQRAIAQALNEQKYAALRTKSIFGPLAIDEQDQMNAAKYHADLGGELGAASSWFRGAVTGGLKFLTFLGSAGPYAAAGYGAGALVGGAAGSLLPGAGTIAGAAYGAGLGGEVGGSVGLARLAFEGGAAPAYDQYLQIRDEAGRPIDPAAAKGAALAVGAINAALMGVQADVILKRVPGLNRLTSLAARDAIATALEQPTTRAALATLVRKYGTSLAEGTALSVGQEAVNILGGEIAKAAASPATVPGMTEPGTFDAFTAPRVENADGSTSTVDSVSVNVDGREVLLPTVTADGRHFEGTLDQRAQQALEEYRRTGRHLGIFDSAEHANAFAEQLHNDYAAGAFDHAGEHLTGPEILARLEQAGLSGLQSFALASLPGPLMEAAGNYARARQAQHGVAFFNALGEGVANSKTAGRLPDAAQELLARATENGPVSHVYAPVETWTQYWQSKGVDPGEIATKLTGDAQAYARARQTGEDLAIPTSSYALNLAATDHNTFFAQELRLGPDAMNAREAAAFEADLQKQVGSNLDTAPASSTSGPVFESVRRQLEAAGFSARQAESQAALHQSIVGSIGERAGLDAEALFNRYGLTISREGLDTPAAGAPDTAQPTTPLEIPESVAGANETSTQRAARRMAHTEAIVSTVTRDALQQDPTVDVPELRREVQFRLANYEEGQHAIVESGQDPGDLLRTIAQFGGLTYEQKSGAYKGEIERLIESRDVKAVKAGTGRIVHNAGRATWGGVAGVFNDAGKSPDRMLEALREEPRFRHLETLNDLLDAVDHALTSSKAVQVDTSRLPGTADLRELGIRLGTRWWDNGRSKVDVSGPGAGEFSDSLDTGSGDTSFEFSQGPAERVTPRDVEELDPRTRALDEHASEASLGVVYDPNKYGPGEGGSSFEGDDKDRSPINCTDCAEVFLEKSNTKGAIYGWPEGTNPTAKVARDMGHDFAIVEDRYLVDPWANQVEESTPRAAYDLNDPQDRAYVLSVYGDPSTWLRRDFSHDQYTWTHDTPTPLKASDAPTTLYQGAVDEGVRSHDTFAAAVDAYRASLEADQGQARARVATATAQRDELAHQQEMATNPAVRQLEFERRLDELQARLGRIGTPPSDTAATTFKQGPKDTIVAGGDYSRDLFGNRVEEQRPRKTRTEKARAVLSRLTGGGAGEAEGQFPTRTQLVTNAWRVMGAPIITTPEQAAAAVAYLARGAQERFDAVVVDKAGRPLAVVGAFKGSIDQVALHVPVITAEAFRVSGAAAIWFAHNHPSGRPNLSKDDINVGVRLADAFRGTNIEFKGVLAVGSKNELGTHGFDFISSTDRAHGQVAPIENDTNGVAVPVVEREFVSTEKMPGGVIDSPANALARVPNIAQGQFGAVLLDTQHNPIGFLPIDPAAAGELRRDGRLDALYRALSISAPQSALIYNPSPETVEPALNLARALNASDIAVLDIVSSSPSGTASLRERGMLPIDQHFRQDDRGVIRFGKDRQFNIRLLQHADLSTFLHETGHFYLEVLGDVAGEVAKLDPGALSDSQRQLLADHGAILQFLGVENRSEIGVDQHEQFARAFEAYLMDGKAPSTELRNAFAQFRAWLVGIYRSVKSLNVTLDDNVRQVFDRLVATDDAIAAAQNEAKITPLFVDAKSAGMTDLEFGSYMNTIREASQRAQEELQARVLTELKREEFSWWKEERASLQADVERELGEQPVYRALSVMRTGMLPDGTPLVEGQEPLPIKLSRDSLVAQFGREMLRKLPRPYLYAADSGVSADTAAEIFGFSSGDELIKSILAARPFKSAVNDEADARMFAKHGDVMRDGRLEELAKAAVEGEHRQTVIQAELKALTKGMVATTIPSADVINAAAQKRVASTRIRDIRPGVFLMASRRASTQAFNLLAEGRDRAGAVRAKLQELANLALYREARDAKERVESMRSTMQSLGGNAARARIGKAGQDYLEQIDSFLDRYELARVPQKTLDRRESLRSWAEARENEGLPVEIPAPLLDDARRVNYQDITLDEFSGVFEAVEQIAHLARLKGELLKSAKGRTFDEERDTLAASIRLHNETRKIPLEFRPADNRWRAVSAWFASHSKIGMLARALDGHVDDGEMWNAVIRPLNAAADAEQARNEKSGAALRDIIDRAYPGKQLAELNRKLYIPAIGDSLSKEARLMVALNWGNEINRARLLADQTRGWNDAQVHAILGTLDARDATFVQNVWDFVNTFWPEIAEKQQRVTGLAPDKVEASPVDITLSDGTTTTLAGGYFPLMYDGRLSPRASVLQQTGEAKLAAQAAYVKATTRRGHTMTRLENVKLPVRLELGVLFQHVQAVIHDLTHHETLIDVGRLLGDHHVQQAIYETKGDQVYGQFTNAVRDIAFGNTSGEGRPTILDNAATWMRTRTQLAMMGWNLWTALQQPFGVFNGMSRVGPTWVMRGLSRWLRDAASMENTVHWIHEVSPFMRSRGSTATVDLREVRQQLTHAGGWFDQMVRTVTLDTVTQQNILESFLWHIGKAQQVADTPTWLGGYMKAMDEDPTDEPRAIALADQAVIDAQGSGHIKDLAQVQRGSPIAKLLMTFYSYGNTVYNSTADAYGKTNFRKAGSTAEFVGHLGLLYAMPALATVALSRALGRSGGDKESWFGEFSRELLNSAMNTMVLVRELSQLIPGSNGEIRDYAGPAGMRAVQSVYTFAQQTQQGKADKAFVRSATSLGGLLFGFPAAQVQRSVDGFVALREGRTKNPLALLAGAPPKRRH